MKLSALPRCAHRQPSILTAMCRKELLLPPTTPDNADSTTLRNFTVLLVCMCFLFVTGERRRKAIIGKSRRRASLPIELTVVKKSSSNECFFFFSIPLSNSFSTTAKSVTKAGDGPRFGRSRGKNACVQSLPHLSRKKKKNRAMV